MTQQTGFPLSLTTPAAPGEMNRAPSGPARGLAPGALVDPATTGTPRPPDTPGEIRDAAGQFEALLVAQMLKHMRETNGGGLLAGGEDQAGLAMVELAEDQLARALSSGGGLGLAQAVAAGLTPREETAAGPATQPSPVR